MIRKMQKADMEAVLQIEHECFLDPYTEVQYTYELEDNPCAYIYVMEEDGKIVGFIDFWITFESCQLCKIAVTSTLQEQGKGYDLMAFMVDYAQQEGCETILLEVRKSNEKAIRFYQNLEFIEINERKQYYRNPVEDAIVFGKILIGEEDEGYNNISD